MNTKKLLTKAFFAGVSVSLSYQGECSCSVTPEGNPVLTLSKFGDEALDSVFHELTHVCQIWAGEGEPIPLGIEITPEGESRWKRVAHLYHKKWDRLGISEEQRSLETTLEREAFSVECPGHKFRDVIVKELKTRKHLPDLQIIDMLPACLFKSVLPKYGVPKKLIPKSEYCFATGPESLRFEDEYAVLSCMRSSKWRVV